MSDIVIYKAKDGHIELNVNLSEETVWLSLNQISKLFGRDKSVISRHLSNIFKNKELEQAQAVAKFATVQKEGKSDLASKNEATALFGNEREQGVQSIFSYFKA